MIFVAWFLVVTAVALQALNIFWAVQSPRSSQAFLLPVLLWYIALVLRGDGVIFQSSGEEIAWVLAVHLFTSLLAFCVGRFREKHAKSLRSPASRR